MPHDQYLSEQCVKAFDAVIKSSRRLRAANDELFAAEKEHRLAGEALDDAERLYYGQSDKAGETLR